MQLQLGATEIGQGADTAFSQMAAETTGISLEKVYIVSTQDTDTAPFDTGAYASRQTYVTGMAVKKCAQQLKARILHYAGFMLGGRPAEEMDVAHDHIVEKATGKELLDMEPWLLPPFTPWSALSTSLRRSPTNAGTIHFPPAAVLWRWKWICPWDR